MKSKLFAEPHWILRYAQNDIPVLRGFEDIP
jgi:hypothetical protein